MNIGSGQPIGHDPLTPEERELAQRLSQLGPSTGPHSNIDARILAAAHDAVIAPRVRDHARRWPVALGVAASLAFAVGIAWRLRPLPEPPLPTESAAATATAVIASAPGTDAAPLSKQETQERPVAEDTKEQPYPESTSVQAARAVAAPKASAPARAAESLDEPSDHERAYAPAMAPPAPPAPATAMGAATATADHDTAASLMAPPEAVERLRRLEAAQPRTGADTGAATNAPTPGTHPASTAVADAVPAAAAAPAPASARQAAPISESNAEDVEFTNADNGDEPPAYANSPQVRDAWLQRIRELLAEGKSKEALDSLREFQRRYPRYLLPEDLGRLKQAQPEPPTP